MKRPFSTPVYGWGLAIIAVITASAIQATLSDIFAPIPFLMFYAASAVTMAYGGLWPGLFATLLSALVINYFFQAPYYDFSASSTDTVRLAFFMLVSGLAHWLFLERQQAIQELVETETLLNTMIESAADYAIFSMDTKGRVLRWNAGAERMFGYTEKEVRCEPGSIIFTPEDRKNGIPGFELQQAHDLGCAEDERFHIRKDGTRFWMSGTTRPMYDSRQRVIGYIKIARDVTERKQAEQERADLLAREQTARLQAETANKILQQFTAVVAHEIRNPVTTIKGFSSTLFDPDIPWREEDRATSLAIMDQEADKVIELINQLLDVSQIQTGRLSIHPQTCSLMDVMDIAHAQLEALTPQHRLVVDVPQTLPTVYIDGQRIAQVIVNLVGNAAKFAPGGTAIFVTARAAGKQIQVEVRDQGGGIPADKREVIFAAFQQLDTDPYTKKQGVGLGLFICKSIIEAHHGKIWIQEANENGTTFAFTLPVANDHHRANGG